MPPTVNELTLSSRLSVVKLPDGIEVPCVLTGEHAVHRFIRWRAPENRCGFCGETFEIDETDPHWSLGIWRCPKEAR